MRRKSKNPSDKWTIKELKEYVRETTNKANEIIRNYNKPGMKADKRYDQRIRKLQQASGQKKIGKNVKVAKLANKAKAELLKQAKGLMSFMKFSEKTKPAEVFDNEKTERAYQTFKDTFGDISRDKYMRLIDVYSQVDLSAFAGDSDPIANAIIDYVDEYDSNTIIRAMNKVIEESHGKGYTPRDMFIKLDEKLENS